MIIDTIDNLNRYAIPHLKAIVQFIEEHDCALLPEGEIEINARELFVRVMNYVPKNAVENRFETHQVYADLQYMVQGMEIMQTTRIKNLIPLTEYDDPGDSRFYKLFDNAAFTDLVMAPGEFAIFFPHEPHRPACLYEGYQGLVKKLIFKIKLQ
ncbi:MAG: YhcH/YjgK/YiaL family protein [Candidatus Omnitrophica bacterium]|nr:YhcH/YjgK/YiaL family protein [Candidatus Omnitrophota bacterium]